MTNQKFNYVYRRTGRTTSSNSILYGNLPIYKLYRQKTPNINGKQPAFNPTNYEEVGNDLWWRPSDRKNGAYRGPASFPPRGTVVGQASYSLAAAMAAEAAKKGGTDSACSGYIKYNEGDEHTYDEKKANCVTAQAPSSSFADKVRNAQKGTIINVGGIINYIATGQTFSWSEYTTKVDTSQKKPAPFGRDKVMLWARLYDASTDTTKWEPNILAIKGVVPYYFHDQTKQFGPLANYEKLNKLMSSSDADTATSNPAGVSSEKGGSRSSGKSKFNNFNGDSAGIDLSSLVDAQVNELMSRGASPSSALASIVDINERAQYNLAFNESATSFDSSEFIQDPSRPENVPPLAGNALPVLRPGEFTPSEISIQVRFSNAGTGYNGSQSIPDVPVMIQTYPYYDANTDSMSFIADKFFFHYKPNNITYSNIGAEWQDIPRVNNTPIVDFKNFKLMKITFEFVVAEKIDEVSSLYASCEAQLKMLRQMATRPEYVQFTNMDTLFSEQLIYPDFFASGVATYFSIVDMSITSVQRSRQGADTQFGSPPGSINRATVNMTVQEVNSSGPPPIFLPRITQPPRTPAPPDDPGKDQLCRSRFMWISPDRWQKKAQPEKCPE